MTIDVCPGSDYWRDLEHLDDLLNSAYDVKSKTEAILQLRKIKNVAENIIHELNHMTGKDYKDYFEKVVMRE